MWATCDLSSAQVQDLSLFLKMDKICKGGEERRHFKQIFSITTFVKVVLRMGQLA